MKLQLCFSMRMYTVVDRWLRVKYLPCNCKAQSSDARTHINAGWMQQPAKPAQLAEWMSFGFKRETTPRNTRWRMKRTGAHPNACTNKCDRAHADKFMLKNYENKHKYMCHFNMQSMIHFTSFFPHYKSLSVSTYFIWRVWIWTNHISSD